VAQKPKSGLDRLIFKVYRPHTQWREESMECWCGNLRKRGHWGDSDVDGRIILRRIFRKLKGRGEGDWMELAQDRNRWRALVSTVKKLRVL
jgi:hypothetical protein